MTDTSSFYRTVRACRTVMRRNGINVGRDCARHPNRDLNRHFDRPTEHARVVNPSKLLETGISLLSPFSHVSARQQRTYNLSRSLNKMQIRRLKLISGRESTSLYLRSNIRIECIVVDRRKIESSTCAFHLGRVTSTDIERCTIKNRYSYGEYCGIDIRRIFENAPR